MTACGRKQTLKISENRRVNGRFREKQTFSVSAETCSKLLEVNDVIEPSPAGAGSYSKAETSSRVGKLG